MTPCDQGTTDFEEGLVDLGATLPSHSEAAEVVQPGDRPFHDPPNFAESAAVFSVASSDEWLDAARAHQLPMTLRVVSAIGVHLVGSLAWVSDLSSNGRNGIQQRQDLRRVVSIGLSVHHGQSRVEREGAVAGMAAGKAKPPRLRRR